MKIDPKNFNKELNKSFSKIDELDIDAPDLEYFSSMVRKEKIKIGKDNNKQFALFLICSLIIASISISMFLYYTKVFMKLHIILLLVPVLILTVRLLTKSKETVK